MELEIQPVSTNANDLEDTSVGSLTNALVDILLLSAEEEGRHKILVQFQQQMAEINGDLHEERAARER